MKKSMRVVVVIAAAAAAISSSQIASGAPSAPANQRGSQSVRPTTNDGDHQIRTAVGKLSGWQVGIFGNVFPALTFSESAMLTFNCALGHTTFLFETPAFAQMVLNEIQFVLGDLPADTTPSAMSGSK